MKRLIFIFILFLPIYGFSNPMYIQDIRISELIFDTDSTWQIEIWCNDTIVNKSITIKSSTDSITVSISCSTHFVLIKSTDYPMDINYDGDRIILQLSKYSYDEIIFGNYSNSYLRVPKKGQSIVNFNNNWVDGSYFGISNTPTPGTENHLDKITLAGNIYDHWGNLFTSSLNYYGKEFGHYFIDIADQWIFPGTSKGSYTVSMAPRKYNLSEMEFFNLSDHMTQYIEIGFLSFDASVPDTTIYRDIHMKYYSGLSSDLMGQTTLSVFPNPCKSQDAIIKYLLPEDVHYAELVISDMSGHVLHSQILSSHRDAVSLKSAPDLMPGVYIINLTNRNTILSSTRMMIISR